MADGISFTVFGKAAPAGSKKAYVRNGIAIIADANDNVKPWKQQVTRTALEAVEVCDWRSVPPLFPTEPVQLTLRFVLKRPKAHFRANGELREDAPHYHTKAPDATKLTRGTEDALSGVIYTDDSQVASLSVLKVYSVGEPECVDITVSPLGVS